MIIIRLMELIIHLALKRELGASISILISGLTLVYFCLFWLSGTLPGLFVSGVASISLVFAMVRLVLFAAGHIPVNDHWAGEWAPLQQIVVALCSLFFAVAFFLLFLGCVAQLGENGGIISVIASSPYQAAFAAMVSNILDADPHIIGEGSWGLGLVASLYLLKFAAVALFLPALVAVLLEVRGKKGLVDDDDVDDLERLGTLSEALERKSGAVRRWQPRNGGRLPSPRPRKR